MTATTPHPVPTNTGRTFAARWLLTALAFPPAGYLGHLIAGAVDSPLPALAGGLTVAALVALAGAAVAALWLPSREPAVADVGNAAASVPAAIRVAAA